MEKKAKVKGTRIKKALKVIGAISLVLVCVVAFFGIRIWRANHAVTLTASDDAVVSTDKGDVRGAIRNGVFSYRGIPYAEATELFKPASEVEAWTGVRDTVEYGNISKQGSLLGMAADPNVGDNNCQNLNLWTPGLDNKNRPIMVWLHGGGFSTGSANEPLYDGTNLAKEQDVVVIGVNHRLNILGHLDLSAYGDEYEKSGNVGIDDIVMALKWIQRNAEHFGGDPQNVTIFGQSGGGAKVIALMNMPEAKGLFSKAIIQSGATPTMGETFATKEIGSRIAELVLDNLNIPRDNVSMIGDVDFAELSAAGDSALATVSEEYKIPAALSDGYDYAWGPVVDERYLSAQPTEGGSFAESENIPLLIGSNLNEWTTRAGENTYSNDERVKAAFAAAYPNESEREYTKVDTLIRPSLIKLMDAKASNGKGPVYSYVFTFDEGLYGSYHGVEIPLIFGNSDQLGTPPDREMGDMMMSLWAEFARSGIPKSDNTPEWEPYSVENRETMILDRESYMAGAHDEELFEVINE